MNTKVTVTLVDSDAKIGNNILKALKPQVENYFRNAFNSIKNQLPQIVIKAIRSAPEYDSLISGELKAEFGLPDSDSRVSAIIDKWNKLEFSYKRVKISGQSLVGSFSLNMIREDYTDVLSMEAASFVTEKGSQLNWLEWLLLYGSQTIIKDYDVVLGADPRSRTGMAIMKGVKSGKWGVPPQFAGTQNDNWITRAIDSADQQILDLLNDSLRA